MPAVSQSRYSTATSSSLSSVAYRPSSSTSMDKPYYSSVTGSYMVPRSSSRSTAYSDRTTTSYSSEYRSHRLTSYSSDYSRHSRAPSISDSDSGASAVKFASRTDRTSPRSRDTSVTRSESARSSRSDPLPRSYLGSTTTEFYNKYSPSNYVPQAQRLSSAVTGDAARQRTSAVDTSSRPPRRARLPETTERQRAVRTTSSDFGLPKNRTSTCIPKAKLSSSAFDKKIHLHDGLRSDSLPIADDNGNDLPLSVNEIRRRFDTKMTVTKLPARDPTLLYKTAHSSDNIYGQLRNLNGSVSSLTDEKPVPVHKPISSDRAVNGTGSLKWEFSGKDSKKNGDGGYTIERIAEPGSDVSTIYIAGKMNGESVPFNSVKNQLNANNVISKILEKSTTIYVGNADKNDDKCKKSDAGGKNVLSIEIGSDRNCPNGTEAGPSSKTSNESRSKHTSDFASYIQISAPAACSSPPNSVQKRFASSNCNGDESGHEPIKNGINLQSTEDDDGSNLRYIDSEPNLESDNKLFVDYNGKDDGAYEEEGFENKTFEHANGHLLRKGVDEVDYSSKIELNGFSKLPDDLSDVEGDVYTVKKLKDDDRNSNGRYVGESSAPETPLAKRKYADTNGDASAYQLYQNDSTVTIKSSSPVNASSTNSILNNSTNSSPCGSLTTSRRRSVDSKSPQPGSGEQFNKSSGLNGLRNIGNTCFMNSVVQCLSNTRPLLEYCGTPDAFAPHINTTLSCMKGALIKAFSTVITELWKADETDGVVNTTSLKTQIQRFAPRFMGYSQQDAQEFLRYLLEGLHEDVNRVTVKPKPILTEIDDNLSDAQKAEESWQRYLRAEDSRVGDIFVGQLKSSLRCTHCSHTSVTFDPFWDLSLPIPSRTGQLKLSQCLSHFTKEEELDGDEKPTCGKCQVRRKCLKWFTVQKFPRVLVLHLKRFSPTERFRGKLNVPVEFPLMGLDMTPFAAVASPGTRGPQPGSAMYNLYAVSNHSGTTYSGHYTAYCKHPYNGEWHEYNDSRVSPILPKNVVSSEAYVLFYELSSGSVPS